MPFTLALNHCSVTFWVFCSPLSLFTLPCPSPHWNDGIAPKKGKMYCKILSKLLGWTCPFAGWLAACLACLPVFTSSLSSLLGIFFFFCWSFHLFFSFLARPRVSVIYVLQSGFRPLDIVAEIPFCLSVSLVIDNFWSLSLWESVCVCLCLSCRNCLNMMISFALSSWPYCLLR